MQVGSEQHIDLIYLAKACSEVWEHYSPEVRQRMYEAQRKSWVVGELRLAHPEILRREAEAIYDKVLACRAV